jgi:hypothetical protein
MVTSGDAWGATVATKIKTPNTTLRRIREHERRESREEFARAVVAKARELGEQHLACDARLVGRWENGDIVCPRPIYQRVLSALLARPFDELGFGGDAMVLPPNRLGLLAPLPRRLTSASTRRAKCGRGSIVGASWSAVR